MRALAHPMRLAILEALGREGPLTATKAAELLDDSPGNMSWHLQTLAKYGFIEEAGGGTGRSRPWRLAAVTHSFDTALDDPRDAAAGDILESTIQERNFQALRQWWAQRRSYPMEWRKAGFVTTTTTYLTPEELNALSEQILVVLAPYKQRLRDRSARPEGSQPVHVVSFGHPVPPTAQGN